MLLRGYQSCNRSNVHSGRRNKPLGIKDISMVIDNNTAVKEKAITLFHKGFNVFPVCSGQDAHTHFSRVTNSHEPCDSMGKRPTVQWRKFGDGQTLQQVEAIFTNHTGNIGIALQKKQVVLDIDAKSGGLDSLKILEFEHELDTETPQSRTGGGGIHFYYQQGFVEVKNGTDVLKHKGLSGIDIKTYGGYVVAPPSVHASGSSYEWIEGWSALDEYVETLEFPLTLITMLDKKDVVQKSPTKGSPDNGKYEPKYTWTQVAEKFTTTYGEGSRNNELVSLAGIMRSRMGGVCVECAIDYFNWANEKNNLFNPVMNSAEIEATVRGVYNNYGHPTKECKHGRKERLINGLYKVHHPKQDTPDNVIQFDEGARRVIANSRQKEWFAMREDIQNRDLHTLETIQGMSVTVSCLDDPLLLVNPEHQVDSKVLSMMVKEAQGPDSKLAERLETCGRFASLVCSKHGERGQTPMSDRSKFCPNCSSQPAQKLKWADALPDAKGESVYREVWIKVSIGSGYGKTGWELQGAFDDAFTRTSQIFSGWKNRKRLKGRVTHRTAGFVLARPTSHMLWKFQVLEDKPNDLDDLIDDLVVKIAETGRPAELGAEHFTKSGEQALRQAMSDSSSIFDAMIDDSDFELFDGFIWALTRRNVFQPLGMLRGELVDLDIPDNGSIICDVTGCHEVLQKHPIWDEPEKKSVANSTPKPPDLQQVLAL